MLKRTLITLLVLSLLMGTAVILPSAAAEASANLVANGDFETDANTDGIADGWTAPADKYVSEGNNTYLSIPAKADYLYSRIPVEPGKTYKVSVDYKNTDATGVFIYLYQYKEDLTAAEKASTSTAAGIFTSTNGEWASYTVFASPVGDDVAWWAPALRSTAVDDASLAFDNLSIVEVAAEEAEFIYSGDMEKGAITAKEGVVRPGGVAVSAATEGASVTLETDSANVRNGNAALKIANTGNDDSATVVLAQSKWAFGESNGGDGTQYYVEAYFKIDEAIQGTGLSCAVNGGTVATASTGFTAAKKGWQKFMTSFVTKSAVSDLKVTFKLEGVGVVYLDDVAIERHITFINGDFAGRWASTSAPSVWTSGVTMAELDADALAGDTYIGLVYDETDGSYYVANKGARYEGNTIPLIQQLSNLTMGATYKVEFDFVDGDSALSAVGLKSAQAAEYVSYDKGIFSNNYNDSDWHHATLYIIPSCNAAGRNINYWNIHLNALDGVTKIKNITMTEVTESGGIQNADGEEVSALENNTTVTAWYARPEAYANYADEASLAERTMITGLYKKEGDRLTLMECYMDTAKGSVIKGGAHSSRPTENRWGNADINGTENPAGHLPAMASRNITVPAEGEYVVKTFAWNSTGAMTPSVAAAMAATAE